MTRTVSLGPVLISAAVALGGMGLAVLVGSGESTLAGLPTLTVLAALAFIIQWAALVPAYVYQTEHYYDLTGSLTYLSLIALAVLAGQQAEAGVRSILLAGLCGIWAARLGTFLFRRVKRAGKDGRFDAIKPDFGRFMLAWTLQGLWVFLTLLAALIGMTQAGPGLDAFALLGALVWLAGFAIEAVADAQKSAFTSNPGNRGRFINVGLWRWSRHPNYFGEIVLWVGIAIIATPVLQGAAWLGWISPLFVAFLLIKVSGIPLLEKRADEKWGGQAEYERYKAQTPVLILRPPGKT
ncbi:MAG: DUF1295 domain-containing protein [Oceanococcaceae bacterium]